MAFVGGERAEAELVPAAGYELHRLDVAPLPRRRPVAAARAALTDARAVRAASALLRRIGADVALGAGGYVAAPLGVAATITRVPLMLMEADSHLGLANRILAPLARRVFLAFPIDGRTGDRYLLTGRPVPPPVRCAKTLARM